MFSEMRVAKLAGEIERDQETPDRAGAHNGAVLIARHVWAFVQDSDFDGHNFVARPDAERRAYVVRACHALAQSMRQGRDQLVDLLNREFAAINDAASSLRFGSNTPVTFGGAATEHDRAAMDRATQIREAFYRRLGDANISLDGNAWPHRIGAVSRASGVPASRFGDVVLGDIAHDIEIVGVFADAVADAHSNDRGGQTTRAPYLFAQCILAWNDAARMPSGHVASPDASKTARSRPSLFLEIKSLMSEAGVPEPYGTSHYTFLEVLKMMRDEPVLLEFQHHNRLPPLAKRKRPDRDEPEQ